MTKRKYYNKRKDKRTGKRMLAHRLIAAQMLGRPLLPGEVVHHRDGDTKNNAPENLLILPSQAMHAHLEHVLRQARNGQPHLFQDQIGIQ